MGAKGEFPSHALRAQPPSGYPEKISQAVFLLLFLFLLVQTVYEQLQKEDWIVKQ
jgi:hypothetical protein